MPGTRVVSAVFAAIALLPTAPAAAQRGAPAGEWPSYGGDVGSTKYSPLDQIDAANFGELEMAWRWRSADGFLSKTEAGGEWYADRDVVFSRLKDDDPLLWRAGRAPYIRNLKATPLMQEGLLFLNTPISIGAAVDPGTGRTVWAYNPKSYESGTTTMTVVWNQRGVAYWTNGEEGDDADSRVYWGTGDGYLLSVDARTGRPEEDFGDGGRVDLMEGLPRANRGERDYLNALLYSMQSPPVVVRDVVVTGASIADRRITKESIPGWVRGWDARTGELRWVFRTVPQEGDEGVETWEDESWRYSGNANVWTMLSGDNEHGIVYLPIGTATNDFYGGHRPGDNLYSESLVAVDVETGEKLWHFQAVRHGLWDYDFPAAPTLIDLPGRNGTAPRQIVAQVSKQGFLYVFDRVTGEPVWKIEDRPVPPATMPGDTAAPTQPFPTKPAPFEYQGVTEDDLADFTPEIRQMALDVIKDYRIGPLYTPPSLPEPGGKRGTIFRPSAGGGANWYGAAVDPETGWLYVPSRNAFSMVTFYTPDPLEGGTLRYTHGGRGRRPAMPEGLPLFKPPYTRMTAIDLFTGEHVWMKPLGNNDTLRNHPLLVDLDLPPLGGDTYTGPLLTKTLLIHGQHAPDDDGGNRLVARDKRTGDVIAEVPLPARGLGTPMTYLWEGRQYIALTVAGRRETDGVPELVAFALP